ncbi:hypothetical protein SUDANB19_02377 [Streptomyces sp. enrichment culture]
MPMCRPPGARSSTFQQGSGSPCSSTISYMRPSARARPSASRLSTASAMCGSPSSRARVSSRTTACGSQYPQRTASISSRRTCSTSVRPGTASASARATGATGSPVISSGSGRMRVRTRRVRAAGPATGSGARAAGPPRSGTSTSMQSRSSSEGAAEKRCRASAASPVIIARSGVLEVPGGTAASLCAYRSAARRRSSLVGRPVRGGSGTSCVMLGPLPRDPRPTTPVTKLSPNADNSVLKHGSSRADEGPARGLPPLRRGVGVGDACQ